MKPHGSYKLLGRSRRNARSDHYDPHALYTDRCDRIVDSLRAQIVEGGTNQSLRIRQIFTNPREVYRVEIAVPELSYQRTTLLDRDALEELLAFDEVRELVVRNFDATSEHG